MRIGTYNVLGFHGFPPEAAARWLLDAPTRVDHFTSVLSGLGCDILALQEGPDAVVMRHVAERMGMQWATFASPTSFPGYVLSHIPIVESRVYAHPGPGGAQAPFSRFAGAVRVALRTRDLWVVNVHLHPNNPEMRLRETDVLLNRLGELENSEAWMVVLGDCNSPPGDPVHQMLRSRGFVNAMAAVGGGLVPTMDTAGVRPQTIDHIYVGPSLSGHLSAAYVVRREGFRLDDPTPGAWVHSDHLPVVADVL